MPQLVVSPGPYRVYPGGVVAVRAAEWMGGARGSLSSEASSLASTGECVRDTQQVAGVSNVLTSTSYGNADDTLVMPMGDIGLTGNTFYTVWVTYFLDGDIDDTYTGALLRQCGQNVWNNVAAIGMHGTTSEPEISPSLATRLIGNIPHFGLTRVFMSDVDVGDTLTLRAFSQTGTSVEVLIDQLIFVPDIGIPSTVSIDGSLAEETSTALVDGADGGDANGKFTFYDASITPNLSADRWFSGAPHASGDFQRFADPDDGEWNLQITAADAVAGTTELHDGSDNPVTAAGYSLHCVRYVPFDTSDTFDNRTTTTDTQDMGVSEEGYGYRVGATVGILPPAAFVSGGVAILRLRQNNSSVQIEFGDDNQGAATQNNTGAKLIADDGHIFSGVVEWTAGSVLNPEWRFYSAVDGGAPGVPSWFIRLFPLTGIWSLYKLSGSPTAFTKIGSDHDISAWIGLGALVGFKIEVKRYVLRCRVWDASGSEPSTWDEEMFKDVRLSGTDFAYPYSDNLDRARAGYVPHCGFGIHIQDDIAVGGEVVPYDLTVHEVHWERDPYGDPEDMEVRMESPQGTFVGEQVVPYGCPHFVYWGSRIWTEAGGGTQRVSFSSKLVNDTGAAELQRGEVTTWYFSRQDYTIVPMNWRQASRKSTSHRVLVRG